MFLSTNILLMTVDKPRRRVIPRNPSERSSSVSCPYPVSIHEDPVTRHRRWVYSSALGTLLPRLQHRAQELLSELAAAQARELVPVVSEAAPVRDAHHKKGERERVAVTSAVNEEGGGNEAGEMIPSLRKECNTLRIIVRALREKDEESQVPREPHKENACLRFLLVMAFFSNRLFIE